MKNLLFCTIILLFFACGNHTVINNCFRNVQVNETISFTDPIYQNLLVDGGSVTASNIDGRTIHIIRNTASNYVAFDLQCPEKDCNTPMQLNSVKLATCACDNNSYSYIQGGAKINGSQNDCTMLIYNVKVIGDNTIQITN